MLKMTKSARFLIAPALIAFAVSSVAMHHEGGTHAAMDGMPGGPGPIPKEFMMALEKCGADQMTLKKAKNLMKQMPKMPPHAGMPPPGKPPAGMPPPGKPPAGMPPPGKPPAGKPPEFMANFMGSLSKEVMKCMDKKR